MNFVRATLSQFVLGLQGSVPVFGERHILRISGNRPLFDSRIRPSGLDHIRRRQGNVPGEWKHSAAACHLFIHLHFYSAGGQHQPQRYCQFQFPVSGRWASAIGVAISLFLVGQTLDRVHDQENHRCVSCPPTPSVDWSLMCLHRFQRRHAGHAAAHCSSRRFGSQHQQRADG